LFHSPKFADAANAEKLTTNAEENSPDARLDEHLIEAALECTFL
jgi:hypothetical protein